MRFLLELVSNPFFLMLLIVFSPVAIARLCRRRSAKREDEPEEWPARAAPRLAVVTCMDSRMPVEQLLGLQSGAAHVIRNAGGIVTEDTIRSLLVSHYLLGTREFFIINHTDCGMMTFRDAE